MEQASATTAAAAPLTAEQRIAALERKLAEAEAEVKAAPLTAEQRIAALETKLDKAEAKVLEFSDKVEKAIAENNEKLEEKYKGERVYWEGKAKEINADIAELRKESGEGSVCKVAGFTPSSSPKRLLAVSNDVEATGVSKFMRETVLRRLPLKSKLSLPSSAALAERMVDLGMEINDQNGLSQWILFRECYSNYCAKYVLPALDRGQHVFIGGAQGIGKSVLTDLLCLMLVEDGHIVVLEHYRQRLLIFGPEPRLEALAHVKTLLEARDYDASGISPNEVYHVPGDELFDALVLSAYVTVIQDLGSVQGQTVTINGRSKKIWISSPNAEKLKPLREDARRLDLCVPPVTVDEMLQIREKWNPHGYSVDQVHERYFKLGGSIRLVLGMSEVKSNDAVGGAINEASRETLHAAFGASFLSLPKGSLSAILLHPVPLNGNPERFRLRFASKDIGRRLFNKFVSPEQRSVGSFLAVARKETAIASFAGYALEANVHDQLCKGIEVRAKKLEKRAAAGDTVREFKLPKLTIATVFSEKDFSDVPLEKLLQNAYFRPSSPDFPTIDSFAILPLSTFIPGAQGLCLVSFQSTTSTCHVTNGAFLNNLFTHAKKKLGDVQRFHVFLTGANGIRTRQKIDMERAQGGPYAPGHEPNVEQWALTLGDEFDELFDMLENSELD